MIKRKGRSTYKKLIELRKNHEVFVYGDFQPILEENEQLYTYLRTYKNETLLFITNFSKDHETVEIPLDIDMSKAELLIGNYKDVANNRNTSQLRAYEVRIYLVQSDNK